MKKKNSKLIFAALSVGALARGVYYFVKNVLNKDSDDFDDDFDDFDDFDDDFDDTTNATSDVREYVTINISEPSNEEPVENMKTEEIVEEATDSEETGEVILEEATENTDEETPNITDEVDLEETLDDDEQEEIIL